ncbi:MAG: hypothetical protein ACOCRX_02030 [Candidatus Woesearchaeota archaeon]
MKKLWNKLWLKEDFVYPNAYKNESDWIIIKPNTKKSILKKIKEQFPNNSFKFALLCNKDNYKQNLSIKNTLISIYNYKLLRYEKLINLKNENKKIIRKFLTKRDIKLFTNIECSQSGDYISFRNSGLNEFLSKEVWNKVYVIDMNNFFNTKSDKLFGRITQNIKLAKKYGFRYSFSTFAKKINERTKIDNFEFIEDFENDLKIIQSHLLK